LQTTTSIALLVAILASGWFEQYAKGSSAKIALDGFAVWVASPFVLMLIPVALAHSVRAQFAILVVSAILAAGGVLLYWDAIFVHIDAQGAFVFLFIPLYQLVVVALTLGAVIYARVRAHLAANRTIERDACKGGARPSL
jgi:hypothetical protein